CLDDAEVVVSHVVVRVEADRLPSRGVTVWRSLPPQLTASDLGSRTVQSSGSGVRAFLCHFISPAVRRTSAHAGFARQRHKDYRDYRTPARAECGTRLACRPVPATRTRISTSHSAKNTEHDCWWR